ncbi:MAG: DivIVA domain-containing protein [bacterium]
MKLSPLDIKKQEFKKSIRGFDSVEVETFLEMVADEYESLFREKNNLADENLRLQTQLRDYQDVEKTLKETLVTAQQSINESRENSEREAELIVREAEMKAEKILEEAKTKLAEMKNELLILKAQKDSFARRLRHLLESQIELIGVLELDDLGFDKYEEKYKKGRVNHPKPPKAQQEKIEFEGIEDVLPEEPLPESDDEKESHPLEATSDLIWKKDKDQSVESNDTKKEEKEKSSRISDQLII